VVYTRKMANNESGHITTSTRGGHFVTSWENLRIERETQKGGIPELGGRVENHPNKQLKADVGEQVRGDCRPKKKKRSRTFRKIQFNGCTVTKIKVTARKRLGRRTHFRTSVRK